MTKLIALLLVALLGHFSSLGQLSKKNWLMGGAVGYTSGRIGTSSAYNLSRQLSIEPNIGYFLIDKLAVGLEGRGIFYKHRLDSRETNAESIGFGPFLRFYITGRPALKCFCCDRF